jgi:hypothetical protein
MMTAAQYRAKAAALVRTADDSHSEADILELERLAREWLKLAVVADWQDSIRWDLL